MEIFLVWFIFFVFGVVWIFFVFFYLESFVSKDVFKVRVISFGFWDRTSLCVKLEVGNVSIVNF